MVTDDPISIGCWWSFLVGRRDLSVESVIELLKEVSSEFHITDWVDVKIEWNRSWKLSVVMGPVVFKALHVPLVDNNNNSLVLGLVNFSVDVLSSLVDDSSFELWEEVLESSNVPVDKISIEALLRESGWSSDVELPSGGTDFCVPVGEAYVLESKLQVLEDVEPGLVVESVPSVLVEFGTEEDELGSSSLSSFASEFHLHTWEPEFAV